MSITDELRRLLDERGVEWKEVDKHTLWWGESVHHQASAYSSILFGESERVHLSAMVTPQQAIDATLGRGECHMTRIEDENRILYGWMECSECGPVYPPAAERIQDAIKFCPFCGARVIGGDE